MSNVGFKSVRLNEISELITKGTTPTSIGHNFSEDGINFIKIESISESGKFIPERMAHIDDACHKALARSQINNGDILFSIAGALGRVAIADESILPANTNQALAIIRLKQSENLYKPFILKCLSSDFVKHQIDASKGGAAQLNLSLAQIGRFEIKIPSINAQKKIAEILSSIDEQIEATERLIEKKTSQRDGLINDLMSGGNKWKQSKLSSLAEIVGGSTPSRVVPEYWGRDYPWATPSDITATPGNYLHTTKEMISEAGLKNSSAKLLPAGSVLMTSRATLGESKISLFPVCTNQGFKSLIPRNGIDSAFLMYQMRRMKGLYSNLGIGTTFLEVNKRDTDNFSIPIPQSELEQKKISSVFLLMDDEIESEQSILNKLKAKKQGLMHDLLTGRVRVN